MRKYSKLEIEEASDKSNWGESKHQEIIKDLLARANKNTKMSIAEANCVCKFIELAIPVDPANRLDLYSFKSCEDYVFKKLYLLYHDDLEGRYLAEDFYGFILEADKKFQIRKLNEFYSEWLHIVQKFNHREELLNHIASEANRELKVLEKIGDQKNLDYRVINQKEKSIVLHSKYIYLTVKGFFEEHPSKEVVVDFNGYKIEINAFSLTHIMFRHYAGVVKQFDTEKSFHFDASINFKIIPYELKSILEKISSTSLLFGQDITHIPVRYKGTLYSIWTKVCQKFHKGKNLSYNRLQTFYPVLEKTEQEVILQTCQELKIDSRISAFRKKL